MKKIFSLLSLTLLTQGLLITNHVQKVQANPVIEIAQTLATFEEYRQHYQHQTLMEQALALLKQKKYSEAREEFFNINPKDASVWYYLGLTSYHLNELSRAIYAFYERLGNTNKAIADYKKALQINPNHQLANGNLAALTTPATTLVRYGYKNYYSDEADRKKREEFQRDMINSSRCTAYGYSNYNSYSNQCY